MTIMKVIVSTLLLFVSVVGSLPASADARSADSGEKPNFILILSDDQAPDTVGAWGNPQIKTPNLDRLSSSGVNFMHTYNPGSWSGAVCLVSRAMLNSGLSAWRARRIHNEEGLGK